MISLKGMCKQYSDARIKQEIEAAKHSIYKIGCYEGSDLLWLIALENEQEEREERKNG